MELKILFLASLCAVLYSAEATLFKGHQGGGYDSGYGGGYGGGYGDIGGGYGGGNHQGYGGYDNKAIVVHKPVLVNKPVVVHQPSVEYKKVYYKPPPPPPPPPVWVKKPVIQNTKEWRLVDVPKVAYKSVLVHPTPYYGGGKGGKFSKFFDKLKW